MSQPEGESQAYFRIHMLLVVIGVSWYVTAISWLIWRIVVGGGFELALGLVVIAVLLTVMVTACGSAAIIALEGRRHESEVKPTPAHPKTISASRWTIPSPLERRTPF
jgi:hypothetical protein